MEQDSGCYKKLESSTFTTVFGNLVMCFLFNVSGCHINAVTASLPKNIPQTKD